MNPAGRGAARHFGRNWVSAAPASTIAAPTGVGRGECAVRGETAGRRGREAEHVQAGLRRLTDPGAMGGTELFSTFV